MKMDDVVAKLKKIRPGYVVAGAGAIVVLLSLFRRKTPQVMDTAAAYDAGTGGSISGGGDSSSLSAITDLANMLEGQRTTIEALTKQTGELSVELDNTKEGFNDAFNNVVSAYAQTQTATASVIKQVNDTFSTQQARTEYDIQKEASDKIKALQTDYEEKSKIFNSDGKLTDSEKASLNLIHMEAEKIGIAAGLGAGGPDGSQRKIVQ
jgi:hypothetical protein